MTYKEPIAFVLGGVIGAAIGIFATKKHYQKVANAEIEGARSAYNQRLAEISLKNYNKPMPDFNVQPKSDEPPKTPYYGMESEYEVSEEEIATAVMSDPGVVLEAIDIEDFMEMNGYEKVNAIVYEDGICATEREDDILNPDETVGIDAINILVRTDTDQMFIRNHTTKTDYEVSYMDDTFTNITGIMLRE